MARTDSAFDRLEASLHRHYGEAAMLQGDAVTVVFTDAVQLIGDNGSYGDIVTTARFMPGTATHPNSLLERLDVTGGLVSSWHLDRRIESKGDAVEWVLRPA